MFSSHLCLSNNSFAMVIALLDLAFVNAIPDNIIQNLAIAVEFFSGTVDGRCAISNYADNHLHGSELKRISGLYCHPDLSRSIGTENSLSATHDETSHGMPLEQSTLDIVSTRMETQRRKNNHATETIPSKSDRIKVLH